MGFFRRKKKVEEVVEDIVEVIEDDDKELRTCIIPLNCLINSHIPDLSYELIAKDVRVCTCHLKWVTDEDGDIVFDTDDEDEWDCYNKHQINIFHGDIHHLFQLLRHIEAEYLTVVLTYYGPNLVDFLHFLPEDKWSSIVREMVIRYGSCHLYNAFPFGGGFPEGFHVYDRTMSEINPYWADTDRFKYYACRYKLEGREKHLIFQYGEDSDE